MPDDERFGDLDADEGGDARAGGAWAGAGEGWAGDEDDGADASADDRADASADNEADAWADDEGGPSTGDEDEDEDVGEDPGEDSGEDADFATIARGATVDEAKRRAVEQLRKVLPTVREVDVEFVVVDEGARGGFLGRGRTPATVEARVRPQALRGGAGAAAPGADAAELLREFLETTVGLMGIPAAVRVSATADGLTAELAGDDLGRLIGRHGATIDALQLVAALVVNRGRRERVQVVVDAQGYRERRARALRALAERTAQKVVREARSVALKPMSAAERKVVHLCLRDHPGVETLSEGIEPYRAVVVSPKRER